MALAFGRWQQASVATVLVSALLAGCATPTPEPSAQRLQRMQTARTLGDDHAALTGYFERESVAALEQADRHVKMASEQHPRRAKRMRAHCERLVGELQALASEYDGLAAQHRRLAQGG